MPDDYNLMMPSVMSATIKDDLSALEHLEVNYTDYVTMLLERSRIF